MHARETLRHPKILHNHPLHSNTNQHVLSSTVQEHVGKNLIERYAVLDRGIALLSSLSRSRKINEGRVDGR